MVAGGSVAAAFVLVAAAGVASGYVHIHRPGSGSGPALTAVTGCSAFQQVTGTLERVTGGSLIIKAASGQPVTVTTTAATPVTMSGPLRRDITDGAAVTVRGSMSHGRIGAAIVTVGQPASAVSPAGFVPVQGTVADAGPAGFTLVTTDGGRIPVTTSGRTLVVIPHASAAQLPAGAAVIAVGQAGPDGTLAARGVAAIVQFPAGPQLRVSLTGCSDRSIVAALAAISTLPATAS